MILIVCLKYSTNRSRLDEHMIIVSSLGIWVFLLRFLLLAVEKHMLMI